MSFINGLATGITDIVTGIMNFLFTVFIDKWYISLPILFYGIWYYYHKW